jgi:hypothetical protein
MSYYWFQDSYALDEENGFDKEVSAALLKTRRQRLYGKGNEITDLCKVDVKDVPISKEVVG